MTTRHTPEPLKTRGHASCLVGPVWNYTEHFDVEADRAYFMEKAEAERLERKRRQQAEWEKKRKRLREQQRQRNAKAIKEWQSRTVPHDEAERCQMLIEIRKLHGKERKIRRIQIAQDLAAEGYGREAIASYLDLHPDTVSRYLPMEVEETKEDPRIEEIQALRDQGKSWREIGLELNMHKDTARKRLDREFAARVNERSRINNRNWRERNAA